MRSDGDGRRCERCATTVVDLSAMTEAQATRTIARAGGGLCVRYRRDADGEVRFAAAPPRRGSRAVAVGLGLLSLVGAIGGGARADTSVPGGTGDGKPPAQEPAQPPAQPPSAVRPPPSPPNAPDRDRHAQRPKRPTPPRVNDDDYVMGKLAF